MYYPQYYQMQQPLQQQQQPAAQATNNSGLIPVPSEMVARNYPVGFGQSVSFRDENLPFLYTKTMGFSQLEPPKFEKYRLVKEEIEAAPEEVSSTVTKEDLDAIWSEIKYIKSNFVKAKKEGSRDDAKSKQHNASNSPA